MTQLNAPQNPHKNCTNNGINQVSHRLIPSVFPNIFFILLLPRSSYAKRCAANDPFTLAAHQQVVTHMESQSHTVFRVPPPPSPHPAFGWLANCLVKITFLAKINSNQSAILEKQKCIKIILGISHTFALPPSPRPPLIPVPGKAPAKGELICLWLFKQIKRHIKNDIVDNWRKQGNIAGLSLLPICRSVYVSAYLYLSVSVLPLQSICVAERWPLYAMARVKTKERSEWRSPCGLFLLLLTLLLLLLLLASVNCFCCSCCGRHKTLYKLSKRWWKI